MTIGPEPSSRMRLRSVLLGIEHVAKDIVERTLRDPARRRAQLCRIADQIRPRFAAHLAAVDFPFWRDVEQLFQPRMNLLERYGAPGGDVVRLARMTFSPLKRAACSAASSAPSLLAL